MAVDPSIALGVKSIDLPDPLNQLTQLYQAQGLQQQNALHGAQMNALARAQTIADAKNQGIAAGYDPATGKFDMTKASTALVNSGQAHLIPEVQNEYNKTQQEQLALQKGQLEQSQAQEREGVRQILAYNTPEDVIAHIDQNLNDGKITAVKAAQLKSEVPNDPNALPAWKVKQTQNLLDAKDQLANQIQQQQTAETGRHNVVSEGIEGTNAATNRQKMLNEVNPELQGNLAQTKAVGTQLGTAQGTAQAALPNVLRIANTSIGHINDIINDPDMQRIVGNPVAGVAAHISGTKEATFYNKQKQLAGDAMASAIAGMQGSGIRGTQVELQAIQSAKNRMDTATTPQAYIQAARDAVNIINGSTATAAQKAGVDPSTINLPAFAAPGAKTPQHSPAVNQALEKYK